MALTIRELSEADYEDILVGWWKDWKWIPPQRDFLPDNGKGGIIVYDGDVPICAGFMYLSNSKLAWVEWIVSNKKYTNRVLRKDAIELLVSKLTEICKMVGCKYVYALIKHPSLINTYKSLGYTKGDSYTSEMIKVL